MNKKKMELRPATKSDSNNFCKKYLPLKKDLNLGGEPVFPYLSALRAAESAEKIPESLILVLQTELEPKS